MATTLQIVNPDSLSEIWLDLHDDDGSNNTSFGTVKTQLKTTFNLSNPTGNPVFFEPPASPGGFLVHKQDELVTTQLNVRLEATSTDNLHLFQGELQRLLRNGGVLKWVPEGYTDTYYIDFEYGYAESLYRGQDLGDTNLRDTNHIDREGVAIVLYRQPYLRGPELDSDTNKLKNSTLLWVGATIPGLWAWASAADITNEAIDSTVVGPLPGWNGAYKFDIATTSGRRLQQTSAVDSFASGDVGTFSYYVKASAAGIVQARAGVQFKEADGTTNVGTESVTSLTAIGTSWTRLPITTSAAGANTSRAQVNIRFDNLSASSVTIYLAAAQLEEASAATTFRSD